jgi:hypothetical protein
VNRWVGAGFLGAGFGLLLRVWVDIFLAFVSARSASNRRGYIHLSDAIRKRFKRYRVKFEATYPQGERKAAGRLFALDLQGG